jgi:hypothetical protein
VHDWLSQNALAFYAAIVGTVALALNLRKYFYDRGKDQLRLTISCVEHAERAGNLERVSASRENDWDGPSMLPGYLIKVINEGAVSAHIADVALVDARGRIESALVPYPGQPNIYRTVREAPQEELVPRAARSFTIYLRRGAPRVVAAQAYVEDATGRRWNTLVGPAA